jgi:hypothetical protein
MRSRRARLVASACGSGEGNTVGCDAGRMPVNLS